MRTYLASLRGLDAALVLACCGAVAIGLGLAALARQRRARLTGLAVTALGLLGLYGLAMWQVVKSR